MKRLVIDKQGVLGNLAAVRERAGSAAIYAVLTGDAWGAGLLELAELLAEHGVTRFAISEPGDAAALRKAGYVEQELLMLRSTANREELEELMDWNVVCSIGSAEAGMALNALAEGRSTVAEAHVQIDCGMGYGGLVASEPDKVVSMYRNLQNVAISGIYTSLQSGSGRARGVEAQLERFREVVDAVQGAGFETGTVHAAGSFAALHYESARLDAVRVGSALLGRCRRSRDDGLQRVGFCEATVEDVRWLPAGHTVGCDDPVRLRRPTRVATLPVGYQNGLCARSPRPQGLLALLRRWRGREQPAVRLGGQKVRVIGRVGAMESLMVVTEI